MTTGTVTAVGPTRWLTAECRHGRCSEVVIDPASGASRVISRSRIAAEESIAANDGPGVVSPDGSTAAVFQAGGPGQRATLHLVDLASGADDPTGVAVGQGSYDMAAAWSPDSRWLFVAERGKLLVVDARSRRVRALGVALPPITQVAVDSGSGPS